MAMLMIWLKIDEPPRTTWRIETTIPKMATATPRGHAHGLSVQAPYANATSRAAYARAQRPSTITAGLATTPPTNRTPNPPSRPKTPPIPARTARIVMPVGRAAVAEPALAGGVQVVDAGGADVGVGSSTGAVSTGGADDGVIGSPGVGSVI